MNIALVLGFGFMVAVTVAGLLLFRRHSLGTRNRIILSFLALMLLVSGYVRQGSIQSDQLALIGLTAAILGAGILFIWRSEKHPPD